MHRQLRAHTDTHIESHKFMCTHTGTCMLRYTHAGTHSHMKELTCRQTCVHVHPCRHLHTNSCRPLCAHLHDQNWLTAVALLGCATVLGTFQTGFLPPNKFCFRGKTVRFEDMKRLEEVNQLELPREIKSKALEFFSLANVLCLSMFDSFTD